MVVSRSIPSDIMYMYLLKRYMQAGAEVKQLAASSSTLHRISFGERT